jgi:CsoR family transcriptional regulator, copper-sensing transcriptional repressor
MARKKKTECDSEESVVTDSAELSNEKKKLINRIRTVRGHLLGIEKMIEEGKPCDEILIQVAAVKSSVHRIGAVILNEHAIDCIIRGDGSEEESRERLEKMIKTLINFSS